MKDDGSLPERLNALLATEEGQTFAIIAGSFLFSFLVIAIVLFFLKRMFNPKVLRTGTPAPAVVRTLEMTGTRINGVFVYRIEVDVTPESGEPFRAWVRRTIPPHETNHVQPGQPVTVRFNPDRPQKEIALAAYGHAGGGGGAGIDGQAAGGGQGADESLTHMTKRELRAILMEQQAEKTRLNEEGVPAQGIVVERIDTGHRVNRIGVVCRLRVKVIGAGGELYDASLLTVIHEQRLERYDPGAEVPLRADPLDPEKVTVDASRTLTSNPGEDPLA